MCISPRENNIIDQDYTNIPGTFKATPSAHQAISPSLTLAYIQAYSYCLIIMELQSKGSCLLRKQTWWNMLVQSWETPERYQGR